MKRDGFTPVQSAFETQFGGHYAGRRVLVTGHTGFKGSWLALWLHRLGAQVSGLALPPDGHPDHTALLHLPIDETHSDLRDARAVNLALARFQPEMVFHLAAQPLVRRSHREPVVTWATNVMGLVNLLEAVRRTPSVKAVVVVTSDKCYANDGGQHVFTEADALGGRDPYSASKACAEIVAASYRASFFSHDDGRGRPVGLATARAGNVIGGADWSDDRLVPDLVRGACAGPPTRLRDPQAVRPWQHVLDPLAGYLLLGQRLWTDPLAPGGAWNFGPGPAGHLPVATLAERLAAHWPAIRTASDTPTGPHQAGWVALDCRKAKDELGWLPVWDIDAALQRTVLWYRQFHERQVVDSEQDLLRYVAEARQLELAWAG